MIGSILDYEKLVYSIIYNYSYNKYDIEDLYQVGMMALEKAKCNYKEGYNCDFSSYAYLYIKGEVLKYIRESRVIKINKDLLKLNSLINRTREILEQKNMRKVTNEEIATFLEVPLYKVEEAIKSSEYVKSLDYELNDDGKELNLYDSIQYTEKGYSDEILDLKDVISNLDEEEKKLIKLRYYEDKSQQETSKILGMNQVQVSRKENKILTKVRKKLTA